MQAAINRQNIRSIKMKQANAAAAKQAAARKRYAAAMRGITPSMLAPSNYIPAALRGKGLAVEKKALDLAATTYALNQTAVITPLNLIRVGSTFCNRIGRKISMKSLRMNGNLNFIRTVADEDYVRIMIVYDRQTNGALPAIADILQDTDQATTNVTNAYSGANVNNVDRFQILKDYHIVLPSGTFTAGVVTNPGFTDPVSATFRVDCYLKLNGLLTQYKSDSAPAVIGDISSGALYLVTFGSAVAGSEGFQLACKTRLRYTDI